MHSNHALLAIMGVTYSKHDQFWKLAGHEILTSSPTSILSAFNIPTSVEYMVVFSDRSPALRNEGRITAEFIDIPLHATLA